MAKEKKVKNEKKSFMKDFKAELKRVVWPTSKQMVNNVTAVIVIVLITAAIVFGLDLIFGAMNEYGINKLKSHVQSSNQEQVQTTQENTTEEDTTTEEQLDTTTEVTDESNTETTNNEEANNTENAQDNNSTTENVAE